MEDFMAYSGSFMPKNREKYKGEITKIHYRSNWEKFFMNYLDKHPNVVKWSSEETVIPYFSNADGKRRRYFVDFWVKYDTGLEVLIEVKPKKETLPPIKPPQLTAGAKRRFMNEIYTWQVNQDKWKAAKHIAEKNGCKFRILTEDGLRKLGMVL
jgi:hypothetical protein